MIAKTATVVLATAFAILFVAFLWSYSVSQPQTAGIYVSIGGPLTRVSRDGPGLLVLQVLRGRKLRVNVADVDEAILTSKLKPATGNRKFVRAVYIAADKNESVGDVIRAVDLVKKTDATLPIVLMTPTMEREVPVRQ
jgi:biopolymer transport protein ExbD